MQKMLCDIFRHLKELPREAGHASFQLATHARKSRVLVQLRVIEWS